MVVLDFEKPIDDLERKLAEMKALADENAVDVSDSVQALEEKIQALKHNIFQNLSRWQRVQLARHPDRPYALDYVEAITDEWQELFGDRAYADDKAMVGGLATIGDLKLVIVGQQKGRDTKSRQYRNFGMPNPEGYRKALRLMKLAEKFNRPVLTLIDTPGAFPGLEAEERGQAEAIARNLLEMSRLKVPIMCIIIGEGASGGALGIGLGDRVYMLENSWYSVISPESCSSILWRNWDHKQEAADALKLTAADNATLGLVDGVLEEPLGGAHRNAEEMAQRIRAKVLADMADLMKHSPEELMTKRVAKFAQMGHVVESTLPAKQPKAPSSAATS